MVKICIQLNLQTVIWFYKQTKGKVLKKFSSPIEHWNYLGVDENLGPVAVSLRREKLDEHKEHGQQYNYRVIFRTSEVC